MRLKISLILVVLFAITITGMLIVAWQTELEGNNKINQTEPSCTTSIPIYYCEDDFTPIVIGESSYYDVCKIAPEHKWVLSTDYGACGEYPMADGRYIRINYKGKDLIVISIEIVSDSIIGDNWEPIQ